jgi:hypothetical protein
MESGLSGAFAGTLQVRINVVFLGAVSFPWFQQWNAFVSESAHVCQHNFDSFLRLRAPRAIGRRETAAQRAAATCARSGAKSAKTDPSAPVTDRENVALVTIATVEATVWGEAERTDELSE